MMLKKYQNPEVDLNEVDLKYYENKDGVNLKAPVKTAKKVSTAFNRKVYFAAQFACMDGDMKKPNGEPTRLSLALKKWGFGSKESARKFANNNKQA